MSNKRKRRIRRAFVRHIDLKVEILRAIREAIK
jgi:hypothetical protein